MTDTLIQLGVAFFGLLAMYMATGDRPAGRRLAPWVGLVGQPFWVWIAIDMKAWGILVITLAYTAVYVRGCFLSIINKGTT